ncbi:MAG: hypothetical protein COU81_03690 [Candidatus Portnoybacteria bacterium CG10_big_fil_rev_8_21_14_0_10_36_7]|uniref:DNA polymerase beta n=1 Tax=Candidatus Portnoybacteria bacterium CG10_big_fil_rev_8_21_14_0_10_36_7 TaxID=1974812 RepID=A0A2M8KD74_9BACT|nr:MAG: hypothetical protein COU81_03690 [Candidatus Portnoybacteria bacterium CG10_big_fil_rev_8_21_14_0_10_36_7]
MANLELAKILYRMAEYMNNIKFKPRAYEKVAQVIEAIPDDIASIYQKKGRKAILDIEGVGEGIADKIEEFITTGKIIEYEKLKKECPVDLDSLTSVEGLGPKKIKILYEELGIKNLVDLEKLVRSREISKLEHFGVKSEENILRGIEFQKKGHGRILLLDAMLLSNLFESRLSNIDGVSRAMTVGYIRRRKDTVGDIDILVIAKNAKVVMTYFTTMSEVHEILAIGETKASVKLKNGIDADIRIIKSKSFGSALQYFTGSKDHNVELRKIAQDKGFKLNEYGLWQEKK